MSIKNGKKFSSLPRNSDIPSLSVNDFPLYINILKCPCNSLDHLTGSYDSVLKLQIYSNAHLWMDELWAVLNHFQTCNMKAQTMQTLQSCVSVLTLALKRKERNKMFVAYQTPVKLFQQWTYIKNHYQNYCESSNACRSICHGS